MSRWRSGNLCRYSAIHIPSDEPRRTALSVPLILPYRIVSAQSSWSGNLYLTYSFMSGNVQLGLLRLELAAGPSAPETAWTDLTIDRIKLCDISPTCRKLHAAILYLLGDAGVNLQGVCRTDENGCAIRVSLTPSDSQGSTWNRTSDGRGKRQNRLSTIFQNLQEGWELEEGRYLLDRLVSRRLKRLSCATTD